MNKNKLLCIVYTVFSLLLVSCATLHNPDGTIDACKLTKPPKEAEIVNVGHAGRVVGYPNLTKVPDNYSGCLKTWLDSDGSLANSLLIISAQFTDGSVSHIEFTEPDTDKIVCEFDSNRV
jgi:hypothetical protein